MTLMLMIWYACSRISQIWPSTLKRGRSRPRGSWSFGLFVASVSSYWLLILCIKLISVSLTQSDTVALLLPYLHRLRSLLPSSFLDLHIYLTRPPSISPSALSKPTTIESILSPLLSSPSNPNPFLTLSTHLGRPHLGRHVDRLLEEGKGEGGRVAISACGPAGLCDRAREAVRERIGGEGGVTGERLCYREEGGTW